MKFIFEPQNIPEVILITPTRFQDERGFFMESYHKEAFAEGGINVEFVQDNHSRSSKGVLRGMHFQKGAHAQGKLVRATQGEIFDVAVDIRKDSPTYGNWVGVLLSVENAQMLYVPAGFAHGFMVTSEWAEVQYKATNFYHPESEGGLLWNDPEVGVIWPAIENPTIAPRDAAWPVLKDITE
ncbi:MAG: dTDP-4-dehydrorhamnose 3,5-epimerase [Candidatus Gracilibacteria bacterium]